MGKRQIIKIDEDLCNGCGLCVPACAEGALELRDGKVRVVAEILCDGLGACLGECPEGALVVEEREAVEFDEAAVEERLREIGRVPEPVAVPAAMATGGCPGSLARSLERAPVAVGAGVTAEGSDRAAESMLEHWPVQLTLVNPMAPFLREADLLISADCVPVAYRRFHEDFLTDRRVVVACPKLDDARAHMEKLVDLFQASRPRSVTVVRMEVPCCYGLMALTEQAAELAGLQAPVEEVVITVSGGRQVAVPAVC
jgi:NAD-dependent dihydropyrimidine dehydrogenase PreA subunit